MDQQDRKSRQTEKQAGRQEAAAQARSLMRRALKGALATLDADSTAPYASLITLATACDGTPLFLISTLARHTRNLLADSRCSILFDGTSGLADPLQGGRVSVSGRAVPTADEDAKRRFLARHPEAASYAGFADFSLYALEIGAAHYVGGFGEIHDLAPDDLLLPLDDSAALIAAEAEIVAHMNSDHADAVRLYATRLLGGEDGAWRLSGCDPEGCDLLLGETTLRLVFPAPVTSPEAARAQFVALAREARG
ncbi:MAG: pyridoxamine 5'-phosphate oxidase family protein [Methyloligellaceae bacterium]